MRYHKKKFESFSKKELADRHKDSLAKLRDEDDYSDGLSENDDDRMMQTLFHQPLSKKIERENHRPEMNIIKANDLRRTMKITLRSSEANRSIKVDEKYLVIPRYFGPPFTTYDSVLGLGLFYFILNSTPLTHDVTCSRLYFDEKI